MNRRDLVKAVAAYTQMEGRQVDEVLRGFQDVVTAVVSKGEPVAISGFAKFAKVERPARMGRNPATGEAIRIKASKKARITPMKVFKDSVMTPSQAPKLPRGVWPLDDSAPRTTGRKSTPGKGAAAKKTTTRSASPAKRTPAGKTTARGAGPAKKTTPKKTVARKAPARKTVARKAPAKKTVATKASSRRR